MAASSSTSSSRRPQSDVFRPRFPLDPFADLAQPWSVDPDNLPIPLAQRSDVILVLGEPTLTDLAPLLGSPQLAYSLVIVTATNTLPVPPSVQPTVRILRLPTPLSADSGALRLVRVLEWAERVGRAWRRKGGAGVLELTDESEDGASHESRHPPVSSLKRLSSFALRSPHIQSVPASPAGSYIDLPGDGSGSGSSSPSSPPPTLSRRGSFRPRSLSARLFSRPSVLPTPLPKRSFDAIVHFLPSKVAPKAQLRLSILVTTVSRPFLSAHARPDPSLNKPISSRRTSGARTGPGHSSTLQSSGSVASLPLTSQLRSDSFYAGPTSATAGHFSSPHAHLLHALPAAHPGQAKLAQGLDAFLSSHVLGSSSTSAATIATTTIDDSDALFAYVLPARALGVQIGDTGFTLAELLLWGSLDGPLTGKAHYRPHSAYIAGAGAVRVRGFGSGTHSRQSPPSSTIPTPPDSPRSEAALMSPPTPPPTAAPGRRHNSHPIPYLRGAAGGGSGGPLSSPSSTARRPHSAYATTQYAASAYERPLPAVPPAAVAKHSPLSASPPRRWVSTVPVNGAGLPTPPESDEDVQEVSGLKTTTMPPPLVRDESYVQVEGPITPSVEELSKSASVRRKRWRFWRREEDGVHY